ncbi:hypothetical protein, partial [Siminovitchia terrae]|uniref:hypothetical protein n=1 Tax=Siminovitchia terrae TaxID=1914933 RepID=UPI0028A96627
ERSSIKSGRKYAKAHLIEDVFTHGRYDPKKWRFINKKSSTFSHMVHTAMSRLFLCWLTAVFPFFPHNFTNLFYITALALYLLGLLIGQHVV